MMKYLFLSFILIILALASCQNNTLKPLAQFAYEEDALRRMYIPVTVEGERFLFLFDTGTTNTYINYPKVSKRIILDTINIYTVLGDIHTYSDSFLSTFCIGVYNLSLDENVLLKDQVIYLHGYKEGMVKLMGNDDGIIGTDIIYDYDWYFDFSNQIVSIYPKGSADLLSLGKENIKLKKLWKEKEFKVQLTLNDTINAEFLCDTGFGTNANEKFDNYKLNKDLILSDSLYWYLNKNVPNCINIKHSDSIYLQLIQSLKIANCQMHNLSGINEKRNFRKENILTVGFIRRFDKMYYDSQKNEIRLYGDNLEKNRTNEREFICEMKRVCLQEKAESHIDEADIYDEINLVGEQIIIVFDSVKDN